MIEETIDNWHKHLKGELEGGLDSLLHKDVVFHSPIVFTPQRGIEITKMYLNAAGANLAGDEGDRSSKQSKDASNRPFRYTKKVMSGNTAILEFESTVAGKFINGVDIIVCDDAGKIVEFRVMIRPLQAINMMHKQMAASLEKMQSA